MSEYNVPQSIARKVAKLCGTSFCKSGRPKATAKPLSDYVCGDVDLKTEIGSLLCREKCNSADVARLEKKLIDNKEIIGPIPHKLLKAEFGTLVSFSAQALNKSEKALKIR